VVGLLQAKAVIVYPIIEPVDLSTPHLGLGFVPACERVRFPYVEGTEGREIWVQPLILEGEALERYIGAGFDFLFHANAGVRPILRFEREVASAGPRREEPANTPTTTSAIAQQNGAGMH